MSASEEDLRGLARDLAAKRRHVDRLLGLAARVSGVDRSDLTQRAEVILAMPPETGDPAAWIGEGRASASLNPEGVPMELAVTAASAGLKFRMVADPAAAYGSGAARYARARRALHEILALAGTGSIANVFDGAIDATLPSGSDDLESYRNGPMCIATEASGPGVAIYLDAQTGGRSYERARSWLAGALPATDDAFTLLDAFEPCADLASVGVEGASPDRCVLKLYWRLRTPQRLDLIGLPILRDTAVSSFLAAMVGGASIPASGLLLSFGIRIADGGLHDAKINLCGHCLGHSALEWEERLARQAEALDIPPVPARALLSEPGFAVSFVTLGVDHQARRRLNLYVRPTAE